MNADQIHQLRRPESFPDARDSPELTETHISWIILTGKFAYKIKKPVSFSFLDFSTLKERKYYCHREVELNQRLTEGIYIDVQPVIRKGKQYRIGSLEEESNSTVIDYAVQMNQVDPELQMDHVLTNGGGTRDQIRRLALKVAAFHRGAEAIPERNFDYLIEQFRDLRSIQSFLEEEKGLATSKIINQAITMAGKVFHSMEGRMQTRLDSGLVRDLHGDLHTGNIFLLDDPQPFDCIEYNDDFRRIDVLDEVAFLYMDLEYHDRPDLAEAFLSRYLAVFSVMKYKIDWQLFAFYKSYRANVRAKVIGLQAEKEEDQEKQTALLDQCLRYLELMKRYLLKLY